MTEGYEAIAVVYDKLNKEIDYKKWADFIESAFDRYLSVRPEIVLDLACGTGSMTKELSERGYDMIGVDGSEQMLSVASERAYVNFGEDNEYRLPILYLLQDMRSFELYGTVGAVVCSLDSINYLLSAEDVDKCFKNVHNYLDPGGLFIFDVNTPYKFENIYNDNAYILEDEIDGAAVFCGWQNSYDRDSRICDFYLTLFSEDENGKYIREEEHQRERMYTLEELKNLLEANRFEWLGAFSDYSFGEISEKSERFYIMARAKK
ncbi:MAG: class I SAM-dependent methyltransferase [Clostridia bacterium]|nr:class I SAM-dependent methyltransferase [Clostridia bacterium]